MEKILTVSIAAYNVEKYIKKALDSCIDQKYTDLLEVLVVDDGAADGTSTIVQQYEDKYPGIIKLIHKENGGYGTTVNTSVTLAKGKYFKLLDGDDWFDSKGLERLLEHLQETKSDIVFNKMYKEYPDKQEIEKDTWDKYIGKTIRLADISEGVFAGMWEMTVSTECLKKNWQKLPGRVFYTDHYYIMQALPYAEYVDFLDYPVYSYRLGYAEQSVSIQSRRKHIDDILKVSELVSTYYRDYCKNTSNYVFARERARFCYMEAHRALMLMPFGISTYKRIKEFDQKLKSIDKGVYSECEKQWGSRRMKALRRSNYLLYFPLAAREYLRNK